MLNDRRPDFKPPTTRGAHFPQGQRGTARKPRESEDRLSVDVEHLETRRPADVPGHEMAWLVYFQ